MPFKPGDIVNNGSETDIFLITDPSRRQCIRLGAFGTGLHFEGISVHVSGFYPSDSATKLVNILEVLSEFYKVEY